MANLQVRDIDDRLYESLRERATREKYLSRPNVYDVNPTDEFLSLVGAWSDDRESD